jgi:hypothetical protein
MIIATPEMAPAMNSVAISRHFLRVSLIKMI